jgi:hypothetical protein
MPRQARLDAPGALQHFMVKGYYSGSVVSALGGFNGWVLHARFVLEIVDKPTNGRAGASGLFEGLLFGQSIEPMNFSVPPHLSKTRSL